MPLNRFRNAIVASVIAAAALAGASGASAPPVGPLPAGPRSQIQTSMGELVAIALPHRSGGLTWRIARPFDAKIVRQVSEGDLGNQVVLVFRAAGSGATSIVLALTRGERAAAYESRRFDVAVR